ncbi:NADH-quinone oxidoreductase subunit NuoI [Buchnera aphidicola]|uniref:NADH-quinone oxidoreductase subunit NuoI n=1 Tax=Buchnera aphidicola TaxID=9 RepID=UPI0030EBBF58
MFLHKVFLYIFTNARSLFLMFKNVFSSRETRMYPEEKISLSKRYRGRIVLTRNEDKTERCVACSLCSSVCPVSCIALERSSCKKTKRWYPKTFKINFSRCIFCGLCEEACPTSAIQLIPDVEMSEYNRKNLVYKKKYLLISGPGKYTDYNFYKFTGISIKNKNPGDLKIEKKPVDPKNLFL